MDINKILEGLDRLFMEEKRDEIEEYLNKYIEQAIRESKPECALMLYNEQIGFYRETGRYEDSVKACDKVLKLMDELNLKGTIPYATALLNIANAHRAAGLLEKSLFYYKEVIPVYEAQLAEDDMYYASLYNNISLLHQELGNFADAKINLKKALKIVINKEEAGFETAVTYANLANTCIELGDDEEAKEYALEAIKMFEDMGVDDAHYSAALSALGSLYYMEKEYENALDMMEKSRVSVEKYLGSDNIQYQRLTDNINIIMDKIKETGGEPSVLSELVEKNTKIENTDIVENVGPENVEIEKNKSEIIETTENERLENIEIEKNESENISFNDFGLTNFDVAIAEAKQEMRKRNKKDRKQHNNKPKTEGVISEETISAQETASKELQPENTISGLELCRSFYEEYGKPMISSKFRLYESRIAVGLVGKGSECFGFDDAQSQDHDFGPGFVMWVTKDVYNAIGKALQAAYDQLPKTYMGIERINTYYGNDRVGVMIIDDFYRNILGVDLFGELGKNNGSENLRTTECWLQIKEYSLAAAVNGEVFRDDEGVFTKYREYLKGYYPKVVWYRKIADSCARFSQNGQYNLLRMANRGEYVAAGLCKAECVKQAMKLNYLLNREYAPHDKWLFKGMPQNQEMSINGYNIRGLIDRISSLPVNQDNEEEILIAVESLAIIFANQLERLNIIGKSNLYLDYNTNELVTKSDTLLTAVVSGKEINRALALLIAREEFMAFDKVKNEGGRASCQNNWPVFKIMRMSQYMTWPEDMLLQYLYEFKVNLVNGRNMIEEKYARMMESTSPLEYARFSKYLPVIPEEKKTIIEQIVRIQVKWMEDFATEYPKLATNARYIHTYEDSEFDTSYETYLRGELGTYSDKLLEMYGRYVVDYAKQRRNLAYEIMNNTINFYGYESLDKANEQ